MYVRKYSHHSETCLVPLYISTQKNPKRSLLLRALYTVSSFFDFENSSQDQLVYIQYIILRSYVNTLTSCKYLDELSLTKVLRIRRLSIFFYTKR